MSELVPLAKAGRNSFWKLTCCTCTYLCAILRTTSKQPEHLEMWNPQIWSPKRSLVLCEDVPPKHLPPEDTERALGMHKDF